MRNFKHSHSLAEHIGGGMEARFYVDGVRVSRADMETIKTRAYAGGRVDCFHTAAREVEGGKTRRVNHSTATY